MTMHDDIVQESVSESKNHGLRRLLLGLVILASMLMLAVGVSTWFVYQDYHSAAQRGTNLAAQVKTACAEGSISQADAKILCEKADRVVEQAPVEPTQTTLKGDPGDNGKDAPPPTSAQVLDAVRVFCATGACRGVVTEQQVRQAVRTYCAINSRCKGPAGINGTDGKTGATGATGASGTDGKDGTNGADGKDAFPFTFSFTVNTLGSGETTYTCIVADPASPATCTPQSSPTP